MASITVNGYATVSFSTELDVDVDDLVSEYLSDNLDSGEFEIQDVNINDVEVNV